MWLIKYELSKTKIIADVFNLQFSCLGMHEVINFQQQTYAYQYIHSGVKDAHIFPVYFYYWVLVFFGLLHKNKEMYHLINHWIWFYDTFPSILCLFGINPWRDDFSTIFWKPSKLQYRVTNQGRQCLHLSPATLPRLMFAVNTSSRRS